MGQSLILETTFLIDLEREHARGHPGPAVEFLEARPDTRLYLPFVVAGELAAGVSLADRARWEAFLAPFYLLAATPDVCWHYGQVFRHLQRQGRMIGANDLWIAAAGLAHGIPVVTRNIDHLQRVPGLDVESY